MMKTGGALGCKNIEQQHCNNTWKADCYRVLALTFNWVKVGHFTDFSHVCSCFSMSFVGILWYGLVWPFFEREQPPLLFFSGMKKVRRPGNLEQDLLFNRRLAQNCNFDALILGPYNQALGGTNGSSGLQDRHHGAHAGKGGYGT